MNREKRTVRPFWVGDSLAKVLEGAVFRFGSDECYTKNSIEVDNPDEYCRRRAELAWVPECGIKSFKEALSEGVAATGIDPTALALLITASTGYLKITEVVFEHSLSDIKGLPATVNLSTSRPKALRAGFHGATITAYLLLTRDIKPSPLRPWRKGTWLARAKFKLVSRSSTSLFRPTALDDEQRDRLGLPKGVVRYLEMGDHEPLQTYDQSYPPTFYVDKKLLDSLDARPNSKLSRFIQVQLVQDFIWGVLSSPAVQEAELTDLDWTDLNDTLLGRILNFIAGNKASNEYRNELIRDVQNNPTKVIAQVENRIGLRKELLTLVDEKQV